jgi:hypothetical protein
MIENKAGLNTNEASLGNRAISNYDLYSDHFQVMVPNQKPAEMDDWSVGVYKMKSLVIKKRINKSEVVVIQFKLTQALVDDTIYIQFENEWKVMELTLTKPVPG